MEHNSATLSGGALFLSSNSLTRTVRIVQSRLTGNTARYGGAVSVLQSTTAEIIDSTIQLNVATDQTHTMGDGGGLWVQVSYFHAVLVGCS
jgi:hypothetical protein